MKNSTSANGQQELAEAYERCRIAATTHYENFPVGSFLAPKHLRKYIHAVYAFARGADDIADEGNLTPSARIQRLEEWQNQLDLSYHGTPSNPVFLALQDTIRQCSLPQREFNDLLVAFRMDVSSAEFNTWQDLLYYSRHSANPIGRLVLAIFRVASPKTVALSDKLCTALQLTNFWQDVSVDSERGRSYFPLEDCRRFGYTFHTPLPNSSDVSFGKLLSYQIDRTRRLYRESARLPGLVPWRLSLELRATWNGGMAILNKIEKSGFDVLSNRPVLGAGDKLRIFTSSLMGYHQ